MNATATPAALIPTTPGTLYKGCHYVARVRARGILCALFIAPAAIGRHAPALWSETYTRIKGAESFIAGLSNTRAMAEAGSKLAAWALDVEVEGNHDFFIPAVDQMERVYRVFKPTPEPNSLFMRAGINLHAEPPAHPYSSDALQQTGVELFREGAAEAIDARTWWSSTQGAGWGGNAWAQNFGSGNQVTWHKRDAFPAFVLRSEIIQ